MPAKDHAAWDTDVAMSMRPWTPLNERRLNAMARTAFLADQSTPRVIRATLTTRREPGAAWQSRLRWASGMGSGITMILLSTASLAFVLSSYSHGGPFSGFHLLPVIMFMYGVVFCLAARPGLRTTRIWRRAFANHCPDCNYDLSASHADPPLDPQTLGINLGPRHCPECGALWPLVPPSYPAEPMLPLRP